MTQDSRVPSGLKPRPKPWPSKSVISLWNGKEAMDRMKSWTQRERGRAILVAPTLSWDSAHLSWVTPVSAPNPTRVQYAPNLHSQLILTTVPENGYSHSYLNGKQRLSDSQTAEQDMNSDVLTLTLFPASALRAIVPAWKSLGMVTSGLTRIQRVTAIESTQGSNLEQKPQRQACRLES